MRATNVILNVMSLLLVVAGLGIISTFFLPTLFLQSSGPEEAVAPQPEDLNVPVMSKGTTSEQTAGTDEPEKAEATENEKALEDQPKDQAQPGEKKPQRKPQKKQRAAVPVPKDKTLWVTVPKMNRVQSAPMPSTTGDDEESLKEFAGIHLQGTGFPWQEEANVYIAGHRLGYPNTSSFLAFWDLNNVNMGDEIHLTDAMGRSYTYRVFKELVVGPSDNFITRPVKGKNIVTLQTCTLPDYSERLIVQAEKVT